MKSSLRESSQMPSLFGRQRPLHLVLGGGKLADILLWRDKRLSAAIVAGFSLIWVLFEVAEYNFVTLLCHILMAIMFILFVWYNAAGLITWRVPEIYDVQIPESTFRFFYIKLNLFLRIFYDISTGKDMKLFFVTIASLFIMSAIGSYFTTLNLLYMTFLCLVTLPVMYERYEYEVEYLASKGNNDVKRLFNKFDSNVLNKIPRGPIKEKKHR
ncbi:hypothetical protein TanjilG_18337 [Lupinus angustifolius]|uniref:Reticulon-like protein n=1 Tax=Lupinus angustifolius TaxID=3871 RepID=A0A1J7HYQ9_LUPAN|nr:PREDICTED: reticulon-like protein B9 [Lupinus angustifolius]OIW06949.1 hypothetical protein TanjilG_18337 [Lupinus angustifolius]